MPTSHRLFALALLATACAHRIALNEYGLHVIDSMSEYRETVRQNPSNRLVDLERQIPGIRLDIRYATANNFMKRQLYPVAKAYLRESAVNALRDVAAELGQQNLGLKIFDAYRPYAITKMMWEPYKNPDYVADPAKGSRHNRGAAVDLTLVDLETGRELAMPTPYDDFTSRASHSCSDLPADVLRNRALLRSVMERHGFTVLESEWWHYDFSGWQKFELLDIPLEELESLHARTAYGRLSTDRRRERPRGPPPSEPDKRISCVEEHIQRESCLPHG